MNELEARAALRPTHLFQSSSIFVKKKRILHWETLRSDPKLFQAGAQLQGDIKAKKHTGFFAICSRSLMLVDSTISANCLCKNLLPNSTSQRTWEEASAKALVSICSVNIKGSLISESFLFWFHLQKNVPNHYPEHLLFRWIVLRIVIFHILLEIEKLSEIKRLL